MSDEYIDDPKAHIGMQSPEYGETICMHSIEYNHPAHCGTSYTWTVTVQDMEGNTSEEEKTCDVCHCLKCNPVEGM